MFNDLRILYYELKKKVNEIQHQKDLIIQKNGGGVIYLMKIKKSLESWMK
jgi:UDP-N-acetylglucosamine transferase subunit ALG13